MLKGTLVHNCLEVLTSNPSASIQNLLKREIMRHMTFTDEERKGLADEERKALADEERKALADEALALVEKALHSPRMVEINKSDEKYPELPFQLKIDGTLIVSGKIDLMWRDPEGIRHILDYKTDPVAQMHESLTVYADRLYREQVLCYAMFLNRTFPEQPVFPCEIYFVEADIIINYSFTKDELEQEKQRLLLSLSNFIGDSGS